MVAQLVKILLPAFSSSIGPYYLLLINPKILYVLQIRYWTHS
jgi:hypothetical protein